MPTKSTATWRPRRHAGLTGGHTGAFLDHQGCGKTAGPTCTTGFHIAVVQWQNGSFQVSCWGFGSLSRCHLQTGVRLVKGQMVSKINRVGSIPTSLPISHGGRVMAARLIPDQEARVRFLHTVPFIGVPLEGRETPNLAKWVRFPQPLPLCVDSSIGRAPACQAGNCGFDSRSTLHLARASAT